ncbi:hypothetical protein [Paenarthrobacter sp. YJN-D]|uniref:hypothetical protein n=1 Tax=Paenarthrobacter sp. YJN-D TaxID=2735317 RepID=UPI001877E295|nr:hypothetical protein [Paenarthrobacter sp. YJN-D]QOT20221.1 hypothetical protein HMI60_01020 [Paenarthrobacter sp. YJN-D]
MVEPHRQKAIDLMARLNESGYSVLTVSTEHPKWLSVAVSQILALTGEDEIITAGHTLEGYDIHSVMDDEQDTAEGKIQVLTEKMLIVAEFGPQKVKTIALPLHATTSVVVNTIRDAMTTRGPENWPDRVAFELDVAGSTFNFPPGQVSTYQHDELPRALKVVTSALTSKVKE